MQSRPTSTSSDPPGPKWSWIGTCAVALLACGDTASGKLRADGWSDPDSGSEQPLCTRDKLYFPVQAANLTPSEDFDYIAVRFIQAGEENGTMDQWVRTQFQTLTESGQACETAAGGMCEDEVAHHPLPFVSTSCAMLCSESSVVTTKGDTVTRWVGPAQMLDLLGTIDTRDDALMLVESSGYSVWCPADEIPGYPKEAVPEIRPIEDGFEVIATKAVETCPVVLRRFRLQVHASGKIDELDTRDLQWSVCG